MMAWRITLTRFPQTWPRSSMSAIVGAAIVGFWVVSAIFGQFIAPYDPFADDVFNALQPPSAAHWFGTDQLGRDVLSRVLVGSRDILTVAPLATLFATAAGTFVGISAGVLGGWIDEAISRLIDAVLAVPAIIVALLAVVAIGASFWTIVFVIALSFTPIIARTVRAAALTERNLDYVAAARLRLESTPYIMFREILPNIRGPILVEMTIRLGYAIFAIATLSFLGFGAQPPSGDWGLSVATSYGMLSSGIWWISVFNALAIASLVVAVNLVADGLQDASR